MADRDWDRGKNSKQNRGIQLRHADSICSFGRIPGRDSLAYGGVLLAVVCFRPAASTTRFELGYRSIELRFHGPSRHRARHVFSESFLDRGPALFALHCCGRRLLGLALSPDRLNLFTLDQSSSRRLGRLGDWIRSDFRPDVEQLRVRLGAES